MDKYFAQLQKDSQRTSPQEKKSPSSQDRASDGAKSSPVATGAADGLEKLANGVVLGKDGKPCRTCTSSAAWRAMMKQKTPPPSPASSASTATSQVTLPPADDCPADVDTLGRHTWTLLHTLAATYPESPTRPQRAEVSQFVRLLGRVYPCGACADDFEDWMRKEPVDASGRKGLGMWMCRAHNEVNRKLGKAEFDCGRWEERWRDGWKDGRCD